VCKDTKFWEISTKEPHFLCFFWSLGTKRAFLNHLGEACKNVGQNVADHFPDVRKTIAMPKGADKEIVDYLLTRYACYLVAQNGDSRKEQIAFAQTYFAVQTRKAELIEQRLQEVERVKARAKLQETEKKLSGILYERGINDKSFAVIRSKGDQALFSGVVPEDLPAEEDVKKVERRLASEEKKAIENKQKNEWLLLRNKGQVFTFAPSNKNGAVVIRPR
jgi:hypothetical protein